jgi:hypothetical protein
MSEVQAFPPWREAAARFMAAGFSSGDTIETCWFYQSLGLEMPRDDTPYKIGERLRLAFVAGFEKLKLHLLSEHNVDLKNILGVGYQWVEPGEQVACSRDDFEHACKKAMTNHLRRSSFVDNDALTDAQRAARTDELARMASLKAIMGSTRRRLPPRSD